MGGHDAGEVASAAIVDALAAIPEQPGLDQLVARLTETLRDVNADLLKIIEFPAVDAGISLPRSTPPAGSREK